MAFSNTSLIFGGSNEYVVIGDVAPLKFDVGNALSISLWFKSTSSATMMLFSKLDHASPNPGYELYLASRKIRFQLIDDLTVPQRVQVEASVDGLTSGGWVHVVLTKDTTETAAGITVYINNSAPLTVANGGLTSLDDTFVSGGGTSFDTTTAAQLGARDGTNNPYTGEIDDPAIFNIELSAAQVAAIFNDGVPKDESGHTGLVWYGTMEGDTFPTIVDQSPNTNDGTMTNMESGDLQTVGAIVGGAVSVITDSADNSDSPHLNVARARPRNAPPSFGGSEYWDGQLSAAHGALDLAGSNTALLVEPARDPFLDRPGEFVPPADLEALGQLLFSGASSIDLWLPPERIATPPPEPEPEPENPRPVVDNFVPPGGSTIDANDAISFDVTDDSGSFTRIIVTATLAGITEVVHDGTQFRGLYAGSSSRTLITNGFRYSVARQGGWTSSPTFETFAIDTEGAEAL